MFKPNEIEAMPLVLEGYFKELENRIMEDIVRRIRINSEITSTADLQMQRLSEMGASKKAVRDYIQQALQLSEQGIDDLYNGAIQKGYNADNDLYTATGRDFVPYAENQQLQQLVEAVKKQTNSDIKNITQSMGFAVRQPDGKLTFQPIADYYQKTLDKAVLDITSGSFDYNTVLKRTVQEMTDSGLRWIDYASGHHNRVPVAVRRAVMTGVNQVTAKIAEQNMELLQTEYVEVSWHRGARPSHQVWQGKIYRWKEKAISNLTFGLNGGTINSKYDILVDDKNVNDNKNITLYIIDGAEKTISDIFSDMNVDEGYLDYITFQEETLKTEQAVAIASISVSNELKVTHCIRFDKILFSDESLLLDIINKDYKNNVSYLTNDFKSFIAHETGHIMHNILALKRAGCDADCRKMTYEQLNKFRIEYNNIQQEIYLSAFTDESFEEIMQIISSELGIMGASAAVELIAQSFGNYYFGEVKSNVANSIVNYFRKEFGKYVSL